MTKVNSRDISLDLHRQLNLYHMRKGPHTLRPGNGVYERLYRRMNELFHAIVSFVKLPQFRSFFFFFVAASEWLAKFGYLAMNFNRQLRSAPIALTHSHVWRKLAFVCLHIRVKSVSFTRHFSLSLLDSFLAFLSAQSEISFALADDGRKIFARGLLRRSQSGICHNAPLKGAFVARSESR